MIDCKNCGVCCLNIGQVPFIWSKDKKEDIPSHLLEEVIKYKNSPRNKATNPCPWLNLIDGTCKHYEHRPIGCREFKLGSDNCLKLRDKYLVDVTIKRTDRSFLKTPEEKYPCSHRGKVIGEGYCKSCGSNKVKINIYDCNIKTSCCIDTMIDGQTHNICKICPDINN